MRLNKIKKNLLPAAAMLLTLGMSSCMADLDKGNIDPTVDAELNVNALYSKCYAGFIMEGNDGSADFTISDAGKSTLLRNIYNFNVLPTDEAICWWSDGGITDVCYNKVEANNETLKFLYYRLMSNITYCNQFLDNVSADQCSDSHMISEVRFLRAYCYYLMLDFFGDAPLIEHISADIPKQAHCYNEKYNESITDRKELLQLGREKLFNFVKTELETAEAGMLEASPKTSSDANYGRVDKAAAWLLLSRLYLNAGVYLNDDGQNNNYWKEAADYAKKVMDAYPLFTENDQTSAAKANGWKPYDMLFIGDNGETNAAKEAVFALKQDGKTTKGWGGSLFMVACHWDAAMRTVNGLEAGTTANNWTGMRVRPEAVDKFTSGRAQTEKIIDKTTKEVREMLTDDRAIFWGLGDKGAKGGRTLSVADNSGFYTGIAAPKWSNNYSEGGTPHDSYDVDIDFFLMRSAEAYLNYAEAEMHLGNATEAKGAVDKIRSRANAPIMQTYSLNDILDERCREFYLEGYRRTDLIRFNQFGGNQATYKWEMKGGAAEGAAFDKYRNVYPIPQSEIDANSSLVQIYGYN